MAPENTITNLLSLENIAFTAKFHLELGHAAECKTTLESLLKEMEKLREIIGNQ